MAEQEYTPNEVDRLAQIIRIADGNHDMGAGALAEAIADSGFLYDIRADERAKRLDRAALERIAAECEADIPYDDGNETAKLIGKRIREALALAPEARDA